MTSAVDKPKPGRGISMLCSVVYRPIQGEFSFSASSTTLPALSNTTQSFAHKFIIAPIKIEAKGFRNPCNV